MPCPTCGHPTDEDGDCLGPLWFEHAPDPVHVNPRPRGNLSPGVAVTSRTVPPPRGLSPVADVVDLVLGPDELPVQPQEPPGTVLVVGPDLDVWVVDEWRLWVGPGGRTLRPSAMGPLLLAEGARLVATPATSGGRPPRTRDHLGAPLREVEEGTATQLALFAGADLAVEPPPLIRALCAVHRAT